MLISQTSHWLLLPPTLLLAFMLATTFGGYLVLAADRGEQVRFGKRQLSIYVREACARGVVWLLTPLGWGNPAPKMLPGAEPRPPVLLLPDSRYNRASFMFLGKFLSNRGFGWVWAVNQSGGDLALKERAEALAARVDELRRVSGAPRIDLVAHGRGGLVAAWYVRHQGGDASVRRLVTLGTPWRGTRMAVFSRSTRVDEYLHGAAILDELQPPPVPTVAVWSEDDPAVVPSSSALPDGADSVHIEAAGHVDMLVSARVFRAVQAALSQPGAAA